jgi:CRISPR/Cas system Type II protein with McrA/HNH and RuvC-like nuclease domain
MTGNPSRDLVHETTQPPVAKTKLYRGLTKDQIEALGPLTVGLDIGIASVGWAVLSPTRIVDLGVRCFDAAEDPKKKISLNQARRTARVGRNRNASRRSRLKRLSELFVNVGLLTTAQCAALFAPIQPKKMKGAPPTTDIWELRSAAVTRTSPLTNEEFARVIHHLVRWRGYGALRKAAEIAATEAKDARDSAADAENAAGASDASVNDSPPPSSSNEPKKTKALPFGDALEKSRSRIARLLSNYQTVGNIAYTLKHLNPETAPAELHSDIELFKKALRNHGDGYERSFNRSDLRNELIAIFKRQAELGNPIATASLPDDAPQMKFVQVGGNPIAEVDSSFLSQSLALFDEQYPPIVQAQLEQMIGKCELEPAEPRASRESFSSERSAWLQRLNRMEVVQSGAARKLNTEERQVVIELPYLLEEVTFAQVRDALCQHAGWSRDWREIRFKDLDYRATAKDGSDLIFCMDGDASTSLYDVALSGITDKKQKKARKEDLARKLSAGDLTYAQVRTLINLPASSRFRVLKKLSHPVRRDQESRFTLPLLYGNEKIFPPGFALKTLDAKTGKASLLKGPRFIPIVQCAERGTSLTLTELRAAVPADAWPQGQWQFVIEEKSTTDISLESETDTMVQLQYSDPQAVEKDRCFRLPGWHKLRRALVGDSPQLWTSFEVAWRQPLSNEGLEAAKRIDSIFQTLTTNFTDTEITKSLEAQGFSNLETAALCNVVTTTFGHLSFLAQRNIRAGLEAGLIYSEACAKSTPPYNHSIRASKKRTRLLPELEHYLHRRIDVRTGKPTGHVERRYKDLANPVVARSFNQARKVLNAIIEVYGSPDRVHIEMARDLSKSGEERKKIQSENKTRAETNVQRREQFERDYPQAIATPRLMRKVRLYNEQNQRCIYSGKTLELNQILADDNYAQEDHILPRSRTGDNSLDNVVLVLAGENQRKSDRTPFEWFGDDAERWRNFEFDIAACATMSERKKARLLLRELNEDEFIARNLVDTRYATRLFASMVRERLLFAGRATADNETIQPDDAGKLKREYFERARVRTPQGGVTAMLRGLWGLNKNREESDLHHAIDACVVAAASPQLIKRVNDFHRSRERFVERDGKIISTETGLVVTPEEHNEYLTQRFPEPFATGHFHQEVMARLSPDGKTYRTKSGELRAFDFANYDEAARASVRPVLVSRAVKRKTSGELHSMNPVAMRLATVRLSQLTHGLLDAKRYGKQFITQWSSLFSKLNSALAQSAGRASDAFPGDQFELPDGSLVKSVRLPIPCLTSEELVELGLASTRARASKFAATFQRIALAKLSTKQVDTWLSLANKKAQDITKADLPPYNFARRNVLLLRELRPHIERFEILDSKPKAARTDADKDALKIALQTLTQGIPKPETTDTMASARRLEQCPDYRPPLIRSLRVPIPSGNGVVVRGGLVALGEATCVDVFKETNRIVFVPRYAMAHAAPARESLESEQTDGEHIVRLLGGMHLRIHHAGLASAFRIVATGETVENGKFIEVEPMFSDQLFEGTFAFYEPSNERPVLELNDRASFAWRNDGYSPPRIRTRLFAMRSERKRSNAVSDPVTKWISRENLDTEQVENYFTIRRNFKIKVDQAESIEVVPIDLLGSTK